jgi:multiple sugar transport system substrate-binding protein
MAPKRRATPLVFTLAMLVSIVGLLAGCGGSSGAGSSGPIDIAFWSSGPTQDVQAIVNAFNQQYKGKYQVTYRSFPYNNETETVNSALSAHKGPDLLEESFTPSAPYIYEGIVEPIAPILKMGGINPTTDFPAAMWNGTSVKGVHYVAPVDALPTILFYNKALFSAAGLNPNQPPTNATQFIADAQKLTNSSKGQWGYVQQPSWPNPFEFPSLLEQFGGKQADAATRKILVDSSAGVNALTFEWDTIYKYHVSPTNASANEYYNLMVQGKNAMMLDGTYEYPLLSKALGSNLGIALLPLIGSKQADFLGQNYWWVFKNSSMSTAKEAAIGKFMDFYYNQSLAVAKQGVLPTWEPTLKNPTFQSLPSMTLQAQALKYGVLNPLIPNWGTTTTTYLYQQINLCLLNKESPSTALQVAAQKMQAEMSTLGGG